MTPSYDESLTRGRFLDPPAMWLLPPSSLATLSLGDYGVRMVALVIVGFVSWWIIAQFVVPRNRAKWERRFTRWSVTIPMVATYFANDAKAVGRDLAKWASPTIFRQRIRDAVDSIDDEWKKLDPRSGDK